MFSANDSQMYDEYELNTCFVATETNTAHTLFHPTNPFINEICGDIYTDSDFQRYNHENGAIDVLTIKQPKHACTDLSSAMVSDIIRDFAVYNTYVPKEHLSDCNRHLSKKRSINNNQRSQSNSVQSLFSRTYRTRYVSCGDDDIYEVPTISRTNKFKHRDKHESKVTLKVDVNNKVDSKQNFDKPRNHYAEKSTNCQLRVDLHSEDLLRRTMEKNLRLQNILRKLLEMRKKENQNEAWHNYINELKNKHGYVSDEPSYIETQYVPDQYDKVDGNDEYIDTNSECVQSIPCQNLLKDFYSVNDAKQINYEDCRYFENDNCDHCDIPANNASNNVFKNNFYCYPTASQGRLMMLNRERAKCSLQKEWHRPLSNNYSGLKFVVADRELHRTHNTKLRGREGTESVSKDTILKYNCIPSDNYLRFKKINATSNKELKKNCNPIIKKNPRDVYTVKQDKNDNLTDARYNQRHVPVEDSHKFKVHSSELKTINHDVSEAHNQNQSCNVRYRKTNKACAVAHDYNVEDSLNYSAHVVDYHKPIEAVKVGHGINKNSLLFRVIDDEISKEIIKDQDINEDEEEYFHCGNSISKRFVYSNQDIRERREPDSKRTNQFCATSQDVMMKLIDSNERNYQVTKNEVGINNLIMIDKGFDAIAEKKTQLSRSSSIIKASRTININNYHCNDSQNRSSKEIDKNSTERFKLAKENIKTEPSCSFSPYNKEQNIQVDVPRTCYVQTDLRVNVLSLLEEETDLSDRKKESIKDKYNRISNDVSTLKQKIKNTQNYAKYGSLSNIESKIDDLMNSINSFIMEIKSKKTMLPINKCTSVNFEYNIPSDNRKTFGFFNPEKIVCGIVTSNSGNTLENLHFRDRIIFNKQAGVSREIFDDIDKNNQITRDIEDEYTSKQSRGCAVQISIEIPTKDQSTAVSRSKVWVTDDKKGRDMSEEVLATTVLGENKQMTIAVNTEPLGLFALLRVSSEAVKRILSYMPSFDYQSYLPVAQSARDARDTRGGVARYICNICGASFGRPSQLSDHIQDHNNLTSTKDCCVCRHALDLRRRRLPGLFACQYCGLQFTRAYCCELHQQTCAKRSGRVHDVSSSLMLLR